MAFTGPRRLHSLPTLVIRLLYLFSCLLSFFVRDANAETIWVQYDDTDGGVQYYGDWYQGPCGAPCLSPNVQALFNRSWHITYPTGGSSGFSYQFMGYGIVVGGLWDNTRPDVVTRATITLDGESIVASHESRNDGTIDTGAVFLSKDRLNYLIHTLTVEVPADTIFMLDYIAIQQELPSEPPTSSSPISTQTSSNQRPAGPSTSTSTSTSVRRSSTTSAIISMGPSGTTTIPVVIPITPNSTASDDLTSTSTATETSEIIVTTSTDSNGHTYIITTMAPSGHNSNSGKGPDFSPALAGAIGAACAAIAAVLVVICMLRRRRRSQVRPGSAEPYILANTTPSSGNSNLSGPASPIPYSPVSALGLYYTGQPQDVRTQADLLSSPPPNTLMAPISPNHPYPFPPSTQQLYPYAPRHPSLSFTPSQGPVYLPYIPPAEKLSRIRSEQYLSPLREGAYAEFRSPVTPLYPRPMDWDIESQSEREQPPPLPIPLHLPLEEPSTMLTTTTTTSTTPRTPRTPRGSSIPASSPIAPLPSPHPSSRRRSSRRKEFLELPINEEPVPVLRIPSAPNRRGRRATTGHVPDRMPHEIMVGVVESRSPASDEDSLPPVVRRQSLSHPAPPAYSPPRLVRNAEMHDGSFR